MNFNKLTRLQINLLRRNFLEKPIYQATFKLHSLVNSNVNFTLINNRTNREKEQFLDRINLSNSLGQVQRRFKGKKGGKGKKSQVDDETDSDEEDDDTSDDESGSEDEGDGNSRIIKIETINTRLDMVLKNGTCLLFF